MDVREKLRIPALRVDDIKSVNPDGYPAAFFARMGQRAKRRVGDACGLTQFGVNHVTLQPGAQSALRHWHSDEDEFVYVLVGEVVLITNAGEQILHAGDAAGFPAGRADAHHFINRSNAPVVYLEVGTRTDIDTCTYPDDDLQWEVRPDGTHRALHKDGTPW
jgi:uncharacterized cupin superfamily protein